jgi:hypothetical protein
MIPFGIAACMTILVICCALAVVAAAGDPR